MKVKQFIADSSLEQFEGLRKFTERKDISIKFVAGSQSGSLGLLYIWYEEVDKK